MNFDLQDEISRAFRQAGFADSALEARALLRAAPNEATARSWLIERLRGVPLAYLCGRKAFYKHEFLIRRGVLIPRPETEHVVEVALRRAPPAEHLVDLGCGSGCLGLSLALEWPQAKLFAVDAASEPCAVTTENAQALGIGARTIVIHGAVENWQPEFLFDVIVANPPYIAEGDSEVEAAVHMYEPHQALYSGADGLEALRNWSVWAMSKLHSGGLFATEIGAGQSAAVKAIMAKLGFREIEIEKDLSGTERVVSVIK